MNSEENFLSEKLFAKYNSSVLNRKQVAEALNISLSQVDKLLRIGIGLPKYKRLGKKRGRIIFPITSVAKFLATTSLIGGYFEE